MLDTRCGMRVSRWYLVSNIQHLAPFIRYLIHTGIIVVHLITHFNSEFQSMYYGKSKRTPGKSSTGS